MRSQLGICGMVLVSGFLCTATALGQAAQAGNAAGRTATPARPQNVKPHPLQATTPPSGPPVNPLGSAATASPAESFALNGNYAYVCDNNEITVINIANPSNLSVVGTATSSLFQNSGNTYCAVQRGTLAVFSVQQNTGIGNTPGFSAFSLTNPLQPQPVSSPTPINKSFFEQPVYIGNDAFMPINAVSADRDGWQNQFGDLIAVDLTHFSNPVLISTLEQPQITQSTTTSATSGQTSVFGAVQADTALVYIGGSSAIGASNNGVGTLQTVDVSNPALMKVVSQLSIPGTIHFHAPLIQGSVAVGIGNTGGWVGSITGGEQGNIVVAVFDVTDHRSPVLLSSTVTNYSVAPGYLVGGGSQATRIGNNLFAFTGIVDVDGNPVLLVVDATNPQAPLFEGSYISQQFTSMQAAGTTLYATLGAGGFATYSIPGGASPLTVCPLSIDAMLVVDQGANITPQGFLNAKAALNLFIDSLHLTPDQIGVVAFGTSATVFEKLGTNGAQANLIVDGIVTGPASTYIGSGIAAAQAELTSARHIPSANQIMIVLSDGADKGALNNSVTISAANAAKAAEITIISMQVGSGSSTLMQSIASPGSNYYGVPTP